MVAPHRRVFAWPANFSMEAGARAFSDGIEAVRPFPTAGVVGGGSHRHEVSRQVDALARPSRGNLQLSGRVAGC